MVRDTDTVSRICVIEYNTGDSLDPRRGPPLPPTRTALRGSPASPPAGVLQRPSTVTRRGAPRSPESWLLLLVSLATREPGLRGPLLPPLPGPRLPPRVSMLLPPRSVPLLPPRPVLRFPPPPPAKRLPGVRAPAGLVLRSESAPQCRRKARPEPLRALLPRTRHAPRDTPHILKNQSGAVDVSIIFELGPIIRQATFRAGFGKSHRLAIHGCHVASAQVGRRIHDCREFSRLMRPCSCITERISDSDMKHQV